MRLWAFHRRRRNRIASAVEQVALRILAVIWLGRTVLRWRHAAH
ncbi:MAG TPA: hypothetical protein VLB86_01055 [Gaiellaceae bacterium]|nr:hypothetical protein [Gaiellaceae bacterium]